MHLVAPNVKTRFFTPTNSYGVSTMLIHSAFMLLSNPVTTLASIPVFAFVPAVGVLMVATALSDRVTN
ncbi:hypothetical protein HK28_02145 [Acetobacter sp. DsW_063]|nr:hypothetical protein HK28_02145 [Acetobacter sp. DsW_063]